MKFTIIILTFAALINLYPQEFGLGLLLDDSLYANSPTAAPLMRGDYSNLPESASLKKNAPTPGNQGPFGTCAGWSTAYAGRTILEAIRNDWTGKEVDNNTFSPSFVYNQIRMTKGCDGGTSLIDALDVVRNQGAAKLNDFGYDCDREVTALDKVKAVNYRIIEYREVASARTDEKTKYVKKSIAEGHPVVIAIDCPPSFSYAGEFWVPKEDEYKNWGRGHGITVVGYDDNRFGGAFELINSWGTFWGKNGFAWVRYTDFEYFCKYAFEMIDKSMPDPNIPDLSGTLQFRESNGFPMKAKFNGEYFTMENPYYSGTLFELRISNNEPAYVYAFSSDLTFKTYRIFPFDDRMVAYLPYRQNNVAIPDEESLNMLDDTPGLSYYCFLYSKEMLDVQEIMKKIEKTKGSMWQRIKKVLGEKMINIKNIDFKSSDVISFNARSKGKTVVPVLIEISHM
ncbi:MAG: cysteine protease [Ignavibacteriaceae bacterium]|nr:cysteine protease [Ignavibacteriaceae bacterium]